MLTKLCRLKRRGPVIMPQLSVRKELWRAEVSLYNVIGLYRF